MLGEHPMQPIELFEMNLRMSLSDEFTVTDDDMTVIGSALVKNGVIVVFDFEQSPDESYPLQVVTALLRQVCSSADRSKSNLVIKLDGDMDVIRRFESFGFRQSENSIYTRNYGSIVPPL